MPSLRPCSSMDQNIGLLSRECWFDSNQGHKVKRACGGIGIRVRLRSVWSNPWEFKSPHAHKNAKVCLSLLSTWAKAITGCTCRIKSANRYQRGLFCGGYVLSAHEKTLIPDMLSERATCSRGLLSGFQKVFPRITLDQLRNNCENGCG